MVPDLRKGIMSPFKGTGKFGSGMINRVVCSLICYMGMNKKGYSSILDYRGERYEMTWRSKRLGLFSGRGSASRRAIYKGCGYDDEDLSRPLIGVVNTANDAGLGHVYINR